MNEDSHVMLHTGNTMPLIGLGTWQLTHKTANTIAYALDIGYKMIDTSSDYGTHKGIGEGIRLTNISRKNFYIVTKVEENDDAYERVLSNLEELGLIFVDMMLIHRPPQNGAGVDLWQGLIKAQREGLVRDIGVSNYSIIQIEELIEATNEVPVVNQIEWSPFGYSPQMKKYCDEKEIIIQAYSPLTRGKRLDDKRLIQLAEKYGVTPVLILLRWSLQYGTFPLPKANKKEHLDENLRVFDFEIIKEDMKYLSSFNEEYSSLGNLPYI